MKLVTFAGPPSAGKTSVIIKTLEHLKSELKIGVIKFDALSTSDDIIYRDAGIPVQVGISGALCPDHYFVSNIDHCFDWGQQQGLDMLITESAGLCNRCSPHIEHVLSISVVDNLAGINTPKKIGPLLKLADVVVIAKGDIVSQAEREVFAFNVKLANPKAQLFFINGITGQGAFDLSRVLKDASVTEKVAGEQLRFPMPAAICSYCTGTTLIGDKFSVGRRMKFKEVTA
ncbi:GTP-binding protein [Celerinatantimonas sp. YJH-8]|uniref:GTP-binding protein n=1 Tax=Celerinatantimonas sp. YJH-8 TaxID=3228714 RepID=UPI0038CB3F41